MSDTTTPGPGHPGDPKHRKDGEPVEENPFVNADLDMSDFGENPDTETAG